ncbi:MAG: methylenetetrahydrofolate reductase [NAD(P)H] [Pseudomonadota bacterium]|nr:methylenetetrahydrofolate reductase [NAD(P)H] [Pseudomonadota bacterium]
MTRRLSFEFFPPKTEAGLEKLSAVRQELAALNPEFFSVTYGAGGSTRERTLKAIDVVRGEGENRIDTAPHISCIAHSKDELSELLDGYQANGISRLVVLRGDAPSGAVGATGDFAYASDFVGFIRERYNDQFHIEVAAYPEMHPQADSYEADLQNFATKVKAGANSAITQYFYNADAYFYFVDRCEQMGLNIPIYPGIMPILNYTNLKRFSSACGAEIPRWIAKQLEAYGDDTASIQAFGNDVVAEMCEDLFAGGAPGLHFYTMNQVEPNQGLAQVLKHMPEITQV